ncbi:MAG: hypothetical protein EB141_00220 [Verrucomicrobia bacterium]|nr:hypothetical protein [Pseudomonadota bacterium]NDB74070.1 hypothetical protein [Verrucomicrobiota bacterium]NDD37002.1 hypothetical protein [Verrucomicrobiota bacterium]NDE96787.1 hypothetical protein [Verrucomicrobiota bacterium]
MTVVLLLSGSKNASIVGVAGAATAAATAPVVSVLPVPVACAATNDSSIAAITSIQLYDDVAGTLGPRSAAELWGLWS